MVLKITNLHILRHLPTCWLYLLERYTVDNQRCTHTASFYNSYSGLLLYSSFQPSENFGDELLVTFENVYSLIKADN